MSDEHSEEDLGGESACYAHLICPECGVVMDGSEHLNNCSWVDRENGLDALGKIEP